VPRELTGELEEDTLLVEIRIGAADKGAQTVAPGSIHPSGERVRWDDDDEPAKVSGTVLKKLVGALAAGALLVRHYPGEGSRHEAALVLGGVLARTPGMEAKDIERFVSAVARAAGDEEADERGRSAAGAVDLLKRGQPTPGLTRMREVWGTELADTATTWLKVKFDTRSAGDAERIDALARLDRIGYDQQRTTAAQELGVRTSTVDK
jgi:hypothetical protein